MEKITYKRTWYAVVEILATAILIWLCVKPVFVLSMGGLGMEQFTLFRGVQLLGQLQWDVNLGIINALFWLFLFVNILMKLIDLMSPITRSKWISFIVMLLALANATSFLVIETGFKEKLSGHGSINSPDDLVSVFFGSSIDVGTTSIFPLVWVAILLLFIGLCIGRSVETIIIDDGGSKSDTAIETHLQEQVPVKTMQAPPSGSFQRETPTIISEEMPKTAVEKITAVGEMPVALNKPVEKKSERRNNRKKILYILGGVLLASIIVGGILFFINSNKSYITEYSVSQNQDEGVWVNYTYYADTKDGLLSTEIEGCGYSTEIVDQHDYDGDGNLEALVLENNGGNSHAPYPSVIYYDQDERCFKQTEEFEMPEPIVKEIDGKWNFIQRTGIRETYFAFEEGKVTVINETVHPVGETDKKYSLSYLFTTDQEGNRTIRYDLDDDGKDELLTVHRGISHAENYGQTMSLEEIKWNNGKKLESSSLVYGSYVHNYCIWGAEIAFLNSKTNGMHDILTDNTHYHRWNGSTYVEWVWNGEELVSLGVDDSQRLVSADGDYSFSGDINSQWHFDMQLHIQGETVTGRYIVRETDNGYVDLRGTVNREGEIRIDEYYDDGTPTGYYFKGTFSKTSISGKYLSTQRRIDMYFHAN